MPDSRLRSALTCITLLCALGCPVGLTAAIVEPAFRLGECRETHVAALTTPVPPDQQVELTNGLTLHYYQENYRPYPLKLGQPVRVCLVNIGSFCGFLEVNTKTYLLHNPYTRRRQLLPDTANLCAKAR